MKTYAVVMAAGKGTRMKSDKPKVVHEVLYKPMINHIVDELKHVGVDEIYVIVGHKAEEVEKLVNDVNIIYQMEQLGTGHALMQCKNALAGKPGTTVVLNGDAPLITSETLKNLIAYHNDNELKGTIMTCDCDLDKKFGRVIREDNQVKEVVEFKDCDSRQINISEMNCGEYCFDNESLFNALEKVNNKNAQNEYYITIMNDDNLKVGGYKIPDLAEVGGINDRVELSEATKILQLKVNKKHLLNGVNIIDIYNTYIGVDVTIAPDTTIEPGCIIKGRSSIGANCHIGPYCEFENVEIKDNVEIKYAVISDSIIENGVDIGPFARLRTNCHILEDAHMGNFVEMKKAVFGKGSKASHLTYVGDATVGSNVNMGCGTITSNYDGKNKFQTIIGDNAFIGCNSNLIAPVSVGENAYVAAGSTITDQVSDNAFAIARARQVNKNGYAKILEEKRNQKGK